VLRRRPRRPASHSARVNGIGAEGSLRICRGSNPTQVTIGASEAWFRRVAGGHGGVGQVRRKDSCENGVGFCRLAGLCEYLIRFPIITRWTIMHRRVSEHATTVPPNASVTQIHKARPCPSGSSFNPEFLSLTGTTRAQNARPANPDVGYWTIPTDGKRDILETNRLPGMLEVWAMKGKENTRFSPPQSAFSI